MNNNNSLITTVLFLWILSVSLNINAQESIVEVNANGDAIVKFVDDGPGEQVKQTTNVRQEKPAFVKGTILFKLKDQDITGPAGLTSTDSELTQKRNALKDKVKINHRLSSINSLFKQAKKEKLRRIYQASIPVDKRVEDVIDEMNADPDVEWAEPDSLYYTQATIPNDPEYPGSTGQQKYLSPINLQSAWDTHTGSADVVVAIIDTGINYNHEDLNDNIWINPGEIAGDGIDNDGNGFIDDDKGWDFVSATDVAAGEDPGPPDNNPMDVHGHGTHVAGIVGAEGNNGIGVTGVAWDVSLMAVRAGYKDTFNQGVLQSADIAEALYYACDNGADIVNMSFGSPGSSLAQFAAIDYCSGLGVLLVAAAGNNKSSSPFYPAANDNVFAVAALDNVASDKASFSNYGIWIDVSAPGQSIDSTLVDGGYGLQSGTSMASPIVAGVAALLKSARPGLTADELALHLRASATSTNASSPDFFMGLGAGKVHADLVTETAALPSHLNIVSLFMEELDGVEDDAFDAGETINIRPTVRNFSGLSESVSITLSTTDPYVWILDDVVDLGIVDPDKRVTSGSDIFQIDVLPGVPKNHVAEVTLTVSNATSTLTSDVFSLDINPLLRNEFLVSHLLGSITSYARPVMGEHSDGSVSLVFHSNNDFRTSNLIYYRMRSPDGTWGSIRRLSFIAPSYGQTDPVMAIGIDNRVHLAYRQTEGPWDQEVYYAVYDPLTNLWQTTAVTIGAGLNVEGINGVTDTKMAIMVDQSNNPIIAWADERGGSGDIYTVRYDGTQWLPEELSFDLDEYIQNIYLSPDINGNPVLVWEKRLPSSSNHEIYYSRYGPAGWSQRVLATSLLGSGTDIEVDAGGVIHLIFRGQGNGGIQYTKFDGEAWSTPSFVSLTSSNPKIVINGSGNPEIFFSSNHTGLFQTTWNGVSWSEARLVDAKIISPGFGRSGDLIVSRSNEIIYSYEDRNIIPNRPIKLLSSTVDESLHPVKPSVTAELINNDEKMVVSISHPVPGDIDEYRIAAGTSPGHHDLTGWLSWSPSTNQDIGLAFHPLRDNQAYYVSVQAAGINGYISRTNVSDPVFATGAPIDPLQAPSRLSGISPDSTQIHLHWSDNATTEQGTEVARSVTGIDGEYLSHEILIGQDITSYIDTTVTGGLEYCYKVRVGESLSVVGEYSHPVCITAYTSLTPPVPPLNLTLSVINSNRIDITWEDFSSDESGFRIERALGVGGAFVELDIVGPNFDSYSDTGLLAQTEYCYRVRAFNDHGDSSYTNIACGTTTPAAPDPLAAPTNVTVTQEGPSAIRLNWTDNATIEQGTEIQRSLTGAGGVYSSLEILIGVNIETYLDVTATAGVEHCYRIRVGESNTNAGPFSTPVCATIGI